MSPLLGGRFTSLLSFLVIYHPRAHISRGRWVFGPAFHFNYLNCTYVRDTSQLHDPQPTGRDKTKLSWWVPVSCGCIQTRGHVSQLSVSVSCCHLSKSWPVSKRNARKPSGCLSPRLRNLYVCIHACVNNLVPGGSLLRALLGRVIWIPICIRMEILDPGPVVLVRTRTEPTLWIPSARGPPVLSMLVL